MKIEYLKRGTPIWVRGYVDGVGNIDFLDSERNVDELDWLIKDKIYYMSDSDFRLDEPDIDQPKPEIPQFVADWIEYCKKRALTLKGLFSNSDMPAKIFDWIFGSDEKCRLMAEAWINGYTVKKEKLYTVEIPNPNVNGRNKIYLCKADNTGKVYLCKGNFNPKKNKNLRLTEAEIRKDFDWAWQWKKEVTE